jgi:regulator of replication initiation timing
MTKQEIEFRDPVVQSVVNKFVDRSDVGFAKYGKTLRDDQSEIFTWLNHLQEELMDATLYLQRLKEEVSTLREEKALLAELNASYADVNDIDVIDAFEVRVKKKNRSKPGNGRGDHYSFTIDEPIRFVSDITNSHLNFRHPDEEN